VSLFLCSVGKGERRLFVLLILDELFKLSLHNLTKLIFCFFASFWLFGGVHAAHHFGCSVGSMLLIFLVVRWGPCCSSFWLFGGVHAAHLFGCSVGSMLLIILVVRWGPCCSSFWLFGGVHAAHLFGCSVRFMLLIFLAVCVVLLFVIYVLGSVL
jgi:hypothetical protein